MQYYSETQQVHIRRGDGGFRYDDAGREIIGFTDTVAVVYRQAVKMAGWYKVRYAGKWYQCYPANHVPAFANLSRPISK